MTQITLFRVARMAAPGQRGVGCAGSPLRTAQNNKKRSATLKTMFAGLAVLVCAVLTLGGCRSYRVLDRDLNALVGKDVRLLVKRLGYPDQQDVALGEKVYTWRLNDCTLHVAVDANGHILRSAHNGSRRECNLMADRIDDEDRDMSPAEASRRVLEADL